MKPRSATGIFYAMLLTLTSALYLPVQHFQFVNWDDLDLVAYNPLLHPPTAESFAKIWTSPHLQLFAPLSYSTWWMLARISPGLLEPSPLHVVNLFLHLASSALAFSILLRCIGKPLPAFAGALIFAIHPVQVESVAWIAEMNNVLAGALSLAAIRLYLLYVDSNPRTRTLWYGLASVVFLLALLAKPTSVVVPLIVVILDMGILRRPARDIVRSSALWLGMALVFAVIARNVQPVTGGILWNHPLIALDALGFYFRQVFWPTNLAIDYARTPGRVWISRQWIINGLVPIFIALLLWLRRRKDSKPAVAALVALVALLPILGLIPFSYQQISTIADRYLYLAMLGPALFVAWFISRFRPAAEIAIILILVAPLAWITSRQLQPWRDSDALAAGILRADPASVIGNRIAAAEFVRTNCFQEAIACYQIALKRAPENIELRYNLANALLRTGKYQQAIDEYQSLRNISPALKLSAMNNVGVAYAKSGRVDLAMDEFKQVLRIDPHNWDAWRNLVLLQNRQPLPAQY